MDNTIAGGIPCGLTPFESLVKEAMEEGNIEESIVRQHARATGSISYFFQYAYAFVFSAFILIKALVTGRRRTSYNRRYSESRSFPPAISNILKATVEGLYTICVYQMVSVPKQPARSFPSRSTEK